MDTDYRSANQVAILANYTSLRGKRTLVAFIKDTNSVLLKRPRGILNRWRKYFCDLLNSVTIQLLETSDEQINKEIYVTEAEVSTTIKFLKAGKPPGKNDIRSEMLKVMNNFGFR